MNILIYTLCALGAVSLAIALRVAWSALRFFLMSPPPIPEYVPEAPTVPPAFHPAKPRRRKRPSITRDRMVRAIHLREQEQAGRWVDSPDQGGK